tara:strand:+ start:380 stop:565 length:186 start_codon:yes stop_codon:yes gene_type:complete
METTIMDNRKPSSKKYLQYIELNIESEDAYYFLQHLQGINAYPKVARRIANDLAETMGYDI